MPSFDYVHQDDLIIKYGKQRPLARILKDVHTYPIIERALWHNWNGSYTHDSGTAYTSVLMPMMGCLLYINYSESLLLL